MVDPEEANPSFVEFCSHLPEDKTDIISRHLHEKIRNHVQLRYKDADLKLEERLVLFFEKVSKFANRDANHHDSENYYTQMVKNWVAAKGPSRALLKETYFFLHCDEAGRSIATAIDEEVFGKVYFDESGQPIADESSQATETTNAGGSKPLGDATSTAVKSLSLVSSFALAEPTHFSNGATKEFGRNGEKAALRRFLECDGPFKWFQLAGSTGQGKSRLAYELICDCLPDWNAGFLLRQDLETFESWCGDWKPDAPTLIVLDEFIGLELQIGEVMRQMVQNSRNYEHDVRILVVEQQRWDEGALEAVSKADAKSTNSRFRPARLQSGWFTKLNLGKTNIDLDYNDFVFEDGVLELSGLSQPDLLQIVAERFKASRRSLTHSKKFIDDALQRIDGSGSPLFALLLAEALLDGSYQKDWSQERILRFVVDRNRNHRWPAEFNDTVIDLGENRYSIILATLATMVSYLDAGRLKELNEAGWPEPESGTLKESSTIVGDPTDLSLTGPREVVRAMRPPLIGQWFVLQSLRKSDRRAMCLEAGWQIAPAELTWFLLRISDHFPLSAVVEELMAYLPENPRSFALYGSVFSILCDAFDRLELPPPSKAMERILQHASKGEPWAVNSAATCLARGTGVEKDMPRAIDMFDELARGEGEYARLAGTQFVSCLRLQGERLFGLPGAFERLKRSADGGNKEATLEILNLRFLGRNVHWNFGATPTPQTQIDLTALGDELSEVSFLFRATECSEYEVEEVLQQVHLASQIFEYNDIFSGQIVRGGIEK